MNPVDSLVREIGRLGFVPSSEIKKYKKWEEADMPVLFQVMAWDSVECIMKQVVYDIDDTHAIFNTCRWTKWMQCVIYVSIIISYQRRKLVQIDYRDCFFVKKDIVIVRVNSTTGVVSPLVCRRYWHINHFIMSILFLAHSGRKTGELPVIDVIYDIMALRKTAYYDVMMSAMDLMFIKDMEGYDPYELHIED